MARTIGIGNQDFETIRREGYFYIDKTDAVIMEFKVQDTDEKDLAETAQNALRQIGERDYQASLAARGIAEERIRKYGFAFCGKKVLIQEENV